MAARSRKAVSLGGGANRLPPGSADATPERLSHARRHGDARIENGARRLGDPFDVLRGRHKLDAASRARNDILWEAGERFRQHWHGGQIDGLAAFDLTRVRVDVSRSAGGPTPSEAALRHRDSYHRACEAVGERLLPVLQHIVIRGQPAASLSHAVAETGHERTAEAIVVERLREALDRLVVLWGMAPPAVRAPATRIRA